MEQTSSAPQSSPNPIHKPRSSSAKVALNLVVAVGVCLVAYFSRNMISSSPKVDEHSDTSELDRIGNFRLLKRIQLNYTDAVITKWQSQETGLRVVHVDYEGTAYYAAIS